MAKKQTLESIQRAISREVEYREMVIVDLQKRLEGSQLCQTCLINRYIEKNKEVINTLVAIYKGELK